MTGAELDLDRLLRLRLVVARFGEMDLAKFTVSVGSYFAGGIETEEQPDAALNGVRESARGLLERVRR